MKGKMMIAVPLIIMLSAMVSCGEKEEYVPGRKYPPGQDGPETEKYNDLGIELHQEGEPYDTYEGLVMAGYQGWQGCKGDGSLLGEFDDFNAWPHYLCNTVYPFRLQPGMLGSGFNFWPDCSEYEKTYEVPGFVMPDGSPARLFSDYDQSTVFTQFRWMKEYGIDGVFAQRFMVYVDENYIYEHEFHNVNLDHVMKASNEYERAVCIMYDLVGMAEKDYLTPEYLMQDLAKLEAKYHFKDRSQGQKYYLYQNGKPLIALVSFAQADMAYNMTQCRRVVELLQAEGYSVMIGVPTFWRDGGPDSPYTNELLSMISTLHPDVLMPWYTGRFDYKGEKHTYKSSSTVTSFEAFKDRIKADAQWCKNAGVLFAPNCFPGFDWSHQKPASIPYDRYRGDFFWSQAYYEIVEAGVHSFYIGMYDEIDEGTQIFKVLRKSDAPSNLGDGSFYVKYDNGTYSTSLRGPTEAQLPEWNSASKWWVRNDELTKTFNGVEDDQEPDHYLWLTGQIGKMLRGEIPLQKTQPKRILVDGE